MELVTYCDLVRLGRRKKRYCTNFKVQRDQFGPWAGSLSLTQVVLVSKSVVRWPQFEKNVEVVNFAIVAIAFELIFVPFYFFKDLETEDFSSVSEDIARKH